MKNYSVIKKGRQCLVVENATDLVIRQHRHASDATRYCDFLNSGGAFDGFTPSFVTKQTKIINTGL